MATLLIHGFTGSARSWGDPIVDGLASAVGSPLLMDLPGHGRHRGDRAPWRFTLEAVEAEIAALTGDEPLDLVGYSMGGRLALAYAVRNPDRVRRLVLESASPGLETEEERRARREADGQLARRIEDEGIDAFVGYWESIPLFESQGALPPEAKARQRALRLQNEPESLAAALRGLGTGQLPSYWGALSDLGVPTLVMVGALDRKFAELGRRMVEVIPRCRLEVVSDAGHTVHLERPEAWLSAVTSFLSPEEGQV